MYRIRIIEKGDIHSLVNIHISSFPNFFLTTLGKEFLVEFYEGVLMEKSSIKIGVFVSDRLIGFAIGTTLKSGFYKKILFQRGFKLFWKSKKVIYKQPLVLLRIVNNLFSKNRINSDDYYGWLLSFCVSPQYRREGLAGMLLKEFERQMKEVNKQLFLTTDANDNLGANAFYLKNDYIAFDDFIVGKRIMKLYGKKL